MLFHETTLSRLPMPGVSVASVSVREGERERERERWERGVVGRMEGEVIGSTVRQFVKNSLEVGLTHLFSASFDIFHAISGRSYCLYGLLNAIV